MVQAAVAKTKAALLFALAVVAGLSMSQVAYAGEEENPEDFMQLHNIEIAFHKAGSTKDLALMLSLFADDAVMIAKGKTYTGKEQIKSYWHGDEAVCIYQPRPAFMAGPRHVLNGGVIATLIDCHSACTAIAALYKAEGRPIGSDPIIWCVTASMQVDYLRPTPIAAPVTLRARVESTEGKRTTVACSLSSGGIETARGRVVAVRVPPSWRGADDKPR